MIENWHATFMTDKIQPFFNSVGKWVPLVETLPGDLVCLQRRIEAVELLVPMHCSSPLVGSAADVTAVLPSPEVPVAV